MIELTRNIRFAINPPDAPGSPNATGSSSTDTNIPKSNLNGYAGTPSMVGFGTHYELRVRVHGDIHPVWGYLIDIKQIDKAARATIIPALGRAFHTPGSSPLHTLAQALPAFNDALVAAGGTETRCSIASIRLFLSPFYSLEVFAMPSSAPSTPTALLRQKFDFAAAHRLHNATLSDDENRRLYGKCNNPRGHGHNYQFEPAVAVPLNSRFRLQDLEAIADRVILEKFDHKNLNEDTAEFHDGSGANPSVENIAKVFYDLLSKELAAKHADVRLHDVTVWETDRTSATFPTR